MKSLCVFCAARSGADPARVEHARAVGRGLAERGIRVVYGGGKIGLMGALADGALEAGGTVTGVIPRSLAAVEMAHPGVKDMRVVDSMHERKTRMHELSEGFLALHGGLGTFEELLEALTWLQLGFHGQPVGVLDPDGYYDPLFDLLDRATGAGFVSPDHRQNLLRAGSLEELLERFGAFRAPGSLVDRVRELS